MEFQVNIVNFLVLILTPLSMCMKRSLTPDEAMGAEFTIWRVSQTDPCESQPAVSTPQTNGDFLSAKRECEKAYNAYASLSEAEHQTCLGFESPDCRDQGSYRMCTVLVPKQRVWGAKYMKPIPLKECAKGIVKRQTKLQHQRRKEEELRAREAEKKRREEEKRREREYRKRNGSKCCLSRRPSGPSNGPSNEQRVEVNLYDGCPFCYCAKCKAQRYAQQQATQQQQQQATLKTPQQSRWGKVASASRNGWGSATSFSSSNSGTKGGRTYSNRAWNYQTGSYQVVDNMPSLNLRPQSSGGGF